MRTAGDPETLIAFSHVWRSGGTTLRYLLNRHFGLRHIDVEFRRVVGRRGFHQQVYTPRDLRVDLRLHPGARSLAGLVLKPFVDFKEYDDRLVWYTTLRDPMRRYLSLYEYLAGTGMESGGFRAWMREFDADNLYVQWMAGEEDLEAARQVLSERFRAVCLLEHFNASLLILRERLGLEGFAVSYQKPLNTSAARKADLHKRMMEQFEEYREEIREHNQLDIQLYDYVTQELWPRQVAEYGAARLEADLEAAFAPAPVTLGQRWRWASGAAYRNLVYRPFASLDRRR